MLVLENRRLIDMTIHRKTKLTSIFFLKKLVFHESFDIGSFKNETYQLDHS